MSLERFEGVEGPDCAKEWRRPESLTVPLNLGDVLVVLIRLAGGDHLPTFDRPESIYRLAQGHRLHVML